MRSSASFSAIFHVVIVLLAFFGLPTLFAPEAPIERLIPVELYTVKDETVLPPPDLEPVPEPEEEAAPVPPEPEVDEVFIPTPSEPVPAPPAPPAPVVAAVPEPAPPAPALSVPEQSDIPPPPPPKPTYVARAEAKPEPTPDPFASLLKSIEEAARDVATLEVRMPEANAAEAPPVTAPTTTLSDQPLSLSVLDAIRYQVEKNWSLPAGASDAADLVVEIEIVLSLDGEVQDARIVDTARLNRAGEEFFRSMAESAVRAVWRASPLRNLPPEKYAQWREITFFFRPPV